MAMDVEKQDCFGFISGQLRDIQLYMHARFDEIDAMFDALGAKIDGVHGKVDGVDGKVDGLRQELPNIVASAVGAALRERGR